MAQVSRLSRLCQLWGPGSHDKVVQAFKLMAAEGGSQQSIRLPTFRETEADYIRSNRVGFVSSRGIQALKVMAAKVMLTQGVHVVQGNVNIGSRGFVFTFLKLQRIVFFILQKNVQVPYVIQGSSGASGSLSNFNLSTIFPEINTTPGPNCQVNLSGQNCQLNLSGENC